jgi:hypothetical protein
MLAPNMTSPPLRSNYPVFTPFPNYLPQNQRIPPTNFAPIPNPVSPKVSKPSPKVEKEVKSNKTTVKEPSEESKKIEEYSKFVESFSTENSQLDNFFDLHPNVEVLKCFIKISQSMGMNNCTIVNWKF